MNVTDLTPFCIAARAKNLVAVGENTWDCNVADTSPMIVSDWNRRWTD